MDLTPSSPPRRHFSIKLLRVKRVWDSRAYPTRPHSRPLQNHERLSSGLGRLLSLLPPVELLVDHPIWSNSSNGLILSLSLHQVHLRSLKKFRIVLELSEPYVTVITEESSDESCLVIVIYVPLTLTSRVISTANPTFSTLFHDHLSVLLESHSVFVV
jgi:hypothetical protein